MDKVLELDIHSIYPHPSNPRKDLGDLTELVDSVKKNGIMQNLTVFKGHWLTSYEAGGITEEEWVEDGYTLLIGHRRHEAALRAGLATVPCRVVPEPSREEQIAIMLEENMQRNDLTVTEQVQAFKQLTLFGMSAEEISGKTGFSESTVRRRLKLKHLEPELLKKQQDSLQLTLSDVEELAKVDDVEEANAILKRADSAAAIKNLVSSYLYEKKRKTAQTEAVKALRAAGAVEYKNIQDAFSAGLRVNSYRNYGSGGYNIAGINDFGVDGIFIVVFGKAKEAVKDNSKSERAKQEAQAIVEQIKGIAEDAKRKALMRIEQAINTGMLMATKQVNPYELGLKLINYYRANSLGLYQNTIEKLRKDLMDANNKSIDTEKFTKTVEGITDLTLQLLIGLWNYSGIKSVRQIWYVGGYKWEYRDTELHFICDFLSNYGLVLTEEERDILNGDSELYKKLEEVQNGI